MSLPVELDHFTGLESEPIALCLGKIIQLIFIGVERACRYFMQQGLPDMSELCIYESDVSFMFQPECSSESRGEDQAASTSTYNNNVR